MVIRICGDLSVLVRVLVALAGLTAVVSHTTFAMEQPPAIHPGDRVLEVFRIGDNVDDAMRRFQQSFTQKKSQPVFQSRNGEGSVVTGAGVKLIYDGQKRITQIIVTNPGLFTDRYIHVQSYQDEVLYAYGRDYRTVALKEGYYIGYPEMGIGFDIDATNQRVRSIVIFAATSYR